MGYGIEPLLTDSLCGEIARPVHRSALSQQRLRGRHCRRCTSLGRDHAADPAAARGDPNSGPVLARRKTHDALWASGAAAAAAFCLFLLGVLSAVRRLYSTTAFVTVTAISAMLVGIAAYFTFSAPARGEPMALFGGVTFRLVRRLVLNLLRYRRFGPHGCSKCGAQLEFLSEQDDDPKLLAGAAARGSKSARSTTMSGFAMPA